MTIIQATENIILLCNSNKAFTFISNLENDRFWRKEIHSTQMSAQPQLGITAKEDAFLSKKVPHHENLLKCTDFSQDNLAVYQTLPDADFYLKSVRQIERLTEHECRFSYTIEFDKNMVKHGLGFGLPTFIINMVVKNDMKKYLKQLKQLLEKKNNTP